MNATLITNVWIYPYHVTLLSLLANKINNNDNKFAIKVASMFIDK